MVVLCKSFCLSHFTSYQEIHLKSAETYNDPLHDTKQLPYLLAHKTRHDFFIRNFRKKL